jgi:hypothetical protein
MGGGIFRGFDSRRLDSFCGVTRLALYASTMAAIEFTDEELKLLREALKSFLDDFGHEEADTVTDIQALPAKLPAQQAA